MENELAIEQRLANFKEAGHHIDPATAKVTCREVNLLDPYGLGPEPEEIYPIGLEYFARSPGSDIWVRFGDIPDAIRMALRERIERERPDEISAVDRQTGEKRTFEQWLAFFEEAGRHIDPETAEVHSSYRNLCDPYGLGFDIPKEYQCVGLVDFARAPGSDVWVSFYDLPDAIRKALWERIDRQAAAERGQSAPGRVRAQSQAGVPKPRLAIVAGIDDQDAVPHSHDAHSSSSARSTR